MSGKPSMAEKLRTSKGQGWVHVITLSRTCTKPQHHLSSPTLLTITEISHQEYLNTNNVAALALKP